MGRPKKKQADRYGRAVATRLTPAQGAAFDELRGAVACGGPVADEAAFLRWLMMLVCEERGIAWPE
jgi:hypothetical protein